MNEKLLLGIGREIITPEIGGQLYGYSPDVFSKEVHDDLTVTVYAFTYGKIKSLFISVTICTVNNELQAELRKSFAEKHNIPFENIIIAATHTHSGPNITGGVGWGDTDFDYYNNIFKPAIIKAVDTAVSNAEPVLVAAAVGESYVGINRRELTDDNKITFGQSPWGVHNPKMTLISFKNMEGRVVGNIISYGCHGTSAGRNTEITRDWSGIMVDRMETESGAFTMYINGAEGDVGPRLSNGKTCGDISLMNELGGIAATDAVRAYKTIKDYRKVNFSAVTDVIKLPYKEMPTVEELKEQIAAMGDPEKFWPFQKLKYSTLLKRIEAVEKGDIETDMVIQQVVFAFNGAVIVPFGFEVFSEIFLRLKCYSPFAYTLGISNANAANAYLPSLDQIPRGGYEVEQFLGRNVFCLMNNTDDNIINENLRLIGKLLDNGHSQ